MGKLREIVGDDPAGYAAAIAADRPAKAEDPEVKTQVRRYEQECGEVETRYDPGMFVWFDKTAMQDMFLTVRKDGTIWVGRQAAERLKAACMCRNGEYRVVIGITRRAIALRPAMEGEKGYSLRPDKWGSTKIGAKRLLDKAGWKRPFRVQAVWDENHKMLVGRVPKEAVLE